MDAREAALWLESKRNAHDLKTFQKMMDEYLPDYHNLTCIHVTGTNGKGSTVHFIAAILERMGYKVGMFTSPYILCHQDRFMINHERMSDEDFLDLISRYHDVLDQFSMFEADVFLALAYFLENKVDIALIEAGIGARHDKTAIVDNIAAIITSVGHDHLAKIGPTLKDVAIEKAGMMKADKPVFVGNVSSDIAEVLRHEAKKTGAIYIPCEPLGDYELGLEGLYQKQNAALALTTVRHLFSPVPEEAVKEGLLDKRWPARMERFMYGGYPVYLDGAHNIEAIQALCENFSGDVTVYYAALKDKDVLGMARYLRRFFTVELVMFQDERALLDNPLPDLKVHASISDALADMKTRPGIKLVCGSLHFVSQFRRMLLDARAVVLR